MRRDTRFVSATLAVGLVCLPVPPHALAQDKPPCPPEARTCPGPAGATRSGGSLGLWAREDATIGAPAATPVAGTPSAPTCSYEAVPEDFDRSKTLADDSSVPRNAIHYVRDCEGRASLLWYVPGTSDPLEDPTITALLEEAIGRVEPVAPQVVTAPPLGTPILTGLPMYLAVDEDAYAPVTGQVTAGQFTVTATLEPTETVFDPGDQHDPRSCDGPGSRWNPGDRPGPDDCTHTYTHTPEHLHGEGETYPLAARVLYLATYTVEGPILAGTYDLGTLEGPATTLDIPVTERRAVRTTG